MIVLCLFVMIVSCKQKADQNVIYLDEINSNDSEAYCSEYFDSIYYVPLETNDNCLIKRIDKLLYADSLFFVFDGKSENVLKFTDKGKFLFNVGSFGKGPAEYLQISDVGINKKDREIYILSNNARKLLKYDFDGNFIKSFALKTHPNKMYISDDGVYIYHAPGSCSYDPIKIYYVNKNFDEHYPLVYYEKNSLEYKYGGLVFSVTGLFDSYYTDFLVPSQSFNFYDREFNKVKSYYIKFKRNKKDVTKVNNNDFVSYSDNNGFVDDVIFVGDIFFISTIFERHMGRIIYNLSEEAGFNVKFDFATIDRAIYNDLDGGYPFWPQGKLNDSVLYATFDVGRYKEYTSRNDNIVSQEATRPSLQTDFYNMIDTLNVMSNPIIQFAKIEKDIYEY